MNYHLAEACGNTFVLYDCLDAKELGLAFFEKVHQDLMKEDRDDALILVDGDFAEGIFHARMVVFGRDKKLGEFCGNGSRSVAAYLFDKYPSAKEGYLLTPAGKHLVEKHGSGVFSIALPPVLLKENGKFIRSSSCYFSAALDKEYHFHYAELLEPHLVLQGELCDEELFLLGKEINSNEELFPLGININACHWIGEGHLFVKTFERGALRITRSCGTGSVCSAAVIWQALGNVLVSTAGGTLEIAMEKEGVKLKGAASYG